MNSRIGSALLASAVAIGASLVSAQAHANTVTLTFGTLPNEVDIDNYFNGGLSAYPPSGTGPNDGVVFSGNANEQKKGVTGAGGQGTGKFENNPSGVNGVLYFAFQASGTSYMNFANGFQGISFDYSLLNNSTLYGTTVDVWSGLNGTGSLIGTLSLNPNANSVTCTNNRDEFCTWSSISDDDFAGTGESLSFVNTNTKFVEYDQIAITAVPEPATWAMMLLGLAGVGYFARRRAGAGNAA